MRTSLRELNIKTSTIDSQGNEWHVELRVGYFQRLKKLQLNPSGVESASVIKHLPADSVDVPRGPESRTYR